MRSQVFRIGPGGITLFRVADRNGFSGTILLVDDNPLRASMRAALLEGATPAISSAVVRAMDASEALCLVELPNFARELALVITGHVMSGISGPDFVSEFRSRMSEVPVLVLSAVPDAEKAYEDIPGVVISQTSSPDELRNLVSRMIRYGNGHASRTA